MFRNLLNYMTERVNNTHFLRSTLRACDPAVVHSVCGLGVVITVSPATLLVVSLRVLESLVCKNDMRPELAVSRMS